MKDLPTIYNKLKKEREEKTKNSLSLKDIMTDEKRAQLSCKESIDTYLDSRPKSLASKSSVYDKQRNRSSMNIVAEVISASGLNSDCESDEDEDYEITENIDDETNDNNLISSDDNASLEINFNNINNNNLYPHDCIASGIEELKSNVSQVANSSVNASVVTQDQINKHLSHQNRNTIKKPIETEPPSIPQITFSLISNNDNSTQSQEENNLLNYEPTENQNETTTKNSKRSKKFKDNTPICHCIIS